jgi:hypothetical protein
VVSGCDADDAEKLEARQLSTKPSTDLSATQRISDNPTVVKIGVDT